MINLNIDDLIDQELQMYKDLANDMEFRAKFKENPREILKERLGLDYSDDVKIYVHENKEKEIHFNLPMDFSSLELLDKTLENVAGGYDTTNLSALLGEDSQAKTIITTVVLSLIPGVAGAVVGGAVGAAQLGVAIAGKVSADATRNQIKEGLGPLLADKGITLT